MTSQVSRRRFVTSSVALVAAAATGEALAQPSPDATITLEIFRAGFIIGGSGGNGMLVYQGQGYQLSVGGVSIGATIGIARTEFIGEVFNLQTPRDIEGTYTALTAGAAVAGGAGVTELQNSRGVRLHLQGRQIGLMVTIDLSGMRISIRN